MGSAWLNADRPRYAQVLVAHLPWAAVCGAVLAVAAFVPPAWVPVRACTFLWLTGYPCLFCGASRAFRSMAHGDWDAALTNSPFAAALFVVVALVFLWNVIALLAGVRLRPGQRLRFWQGRVLVVVLVLGGLVLANWGYRLAMGFK